MSVDSDFTIRWRTPGVIDAAVRDPQSGVVDVRWTRFQGWSCSCAEGPPCHLVDAIRQLTDGEV